jgi:hypothetical protein
MFLGRARCLPKGSACPSLIHGDTFRTGRYPLRKVSIPPSEGGNGRWVLKDGWYFIRCWLMRRGNGEDWDEDQHRRK